MADATTNLILTTMQMVSIPIFIYIKEPVWVGVVGKEVTLDSNA